MVLKRGIAFLLVAAAALATSEASPIKVHSDLKHPVVKDVKSEHGKLILTLQEDPKFVKKTVVKKHHDAKKHEVAKKEKKEVKKLDVKKPFAVKVAAKKDQHKKHPAKKEAKKAHHKQVSEEKKGNEDIRKYAHGKVRIMAKNQPGDHKKEEVKKANKDEHKKTKKQVKEEVVEEEAESADEEEDLDLKVGEEVKIEFAKHTILLELLQNGSVLLTADQEQYVLPHADSLDLTVDDSDDEDSSASEASSSSAATDAVPASKKAVPGTFLDEVEAEASTVAKKFTELATKLTGDGKFISKEAAPIVFVGGVIGALAAVVGIAAVAVGRARGSSADADPQSVLADATEDVEAGVTAEATEDAGADETQSLSSSDSESDAEEDSEEGKFTNAVASV